MTKLTNHEIECLDALAGAWNIFMALPEQHPTDRQEFMYALHTVQRFVLARPGQRSLPAMKEPEPTETPVAEKKRPPQKPDPAELMRQIDKAFLATDQAFDVLIEWEKQNPHRPPQRDLLLDQVNTNLTKLRLALYALSQNF